MAVTVNPQVSRIDVNDSNESESIPVNIGLMKGDILVYRGEGDVVRLPVGLDDQVLTADHTSEFGLKWKLVSGGGNASVLTNLHNATEESVSTGTVVKLSDGLNFVKATANSADTLFVTSEACGPDEDVDCYSLRNSVCFVRCTSAAVAIGDKLVISATDGLCEKKSSDSQYEVAVALSAKASGSVGTVKSILTSGTVLTASDIPNLDTSKLTSGILPVARGGTGNANGTASRLTTARTLKTNLAVETEASFDGSANASLGVSGVLPLRNGGTGGTDSGWQELTNSTVFDGTIYYRKIGILLYIYAQAIKIKNGLASLSNVVLATLPTGYHPSRDLTLACFENNTNLANRPLGCRAVGDGRIFLFSNNGALTADNTIYMSGMTFGG